MDILLVARRLTRRHPVLPNVESIVCRVDDIRVVGLTTLFEPRDEGIHHLIQRLQRAQSLAVEMVLVVNDGLISQREVLHPSASGWHLGVEIRRPWDLGIWKEI